MKLRTRGGVGFRRWGRVGLGLAVALALWFVVSQFGPQWLAALVALLATSVIAGLTEAHAPAAVRLVTGEAAVSAAAGADLAAYNDGWSVVLPGELKEDSLANGQSHLEARARLIALGAYDLEYTHLQLLLEGRGPRAVVITEIRVKILSREPSLAGTLVTSPSAGMQELVGLEFDLDEAAPVAKNQDGVPIFRDYTLTLSEGEVQAFRVVGNARAAACTWELEIDFTYGGSGRVLRLSGAGGPFRTSGTSDSYGSQYRWAWYEQPARLVASTEDSELGGSHP